MDITYAKPREVSRKRMLGEITDGEFAVINNMWGRGLKTILDEHQIEFHNQDNTPVAVIDRGSNTARMYPSQCGSLEESIFYGLAGHEDKKTGYSVERV